MKRHHTAVLPVCAVLLVVALAASCGFFTMEVKLIADPREGPAPLTVDFLLSVDDFHHPDRYDWNYGGGIDKVSTNKNRSSYTYEQPGTYTASCHASQDRAIGQNFYEGDKVSITVFDPAAGELQASITAERTGNDVEGLIEVECTSTVTGGIEPYTYAWDFDDGSGPMTGPNPTYLYFDDGQSHTIVLEVTDDEGSKAVSNEVVIDLGA